MELGEEAAVGDVLEAGRGHALRRVLQERLHHLHALDLVPVVHEVDVILPPLGEVLLRHAADRLRLVDDVIAAVVFVVAVDGEVGAHDDAEDKVSVLVRDGVALDLALLAREGEEV